MMSCVENAFTPLAQYMEAIKTGDPYDVIVGFDYDWTRHLTDNGNDLENFLEQIAIQQPKSIDIAAHSEGVPVSLYAASQAPHRALIRNIFTMAGPILGTPVPQSGLADLLLYAHYKYGSDSCPASQTIRQLSFDALFNSPFVQDLQPNSSALSDTILPAIRTNLSQTNIFVAGGTNPDVLGTLVYNNPVTPLTGSSPFPGPNDGIVGLDSALAFNSGFVVHPFPPFNLFHPNLPSDNSSNGVLSDIASQVARTNSATQDSLPDLTCDGNGLSCSGTQDHQFNFDGAGFTPNATAATLYQQDQTGSVIALESLTVDGSGNFIWIAPSCLQPMGMYSMFAFDQVLAGNNIMQTVDAGSCGSPNPIPSISVLSPSSVLVGSAPLTLTINGSGFTANSSVEFNLASRVRTYVNSGQITIPLSASDVATVGEFQVIVTNPSPGGGSSNAVSFSVYSGNPTPTITQVYPTSLQVGSAPQTLTINGTGFLASSTVTFNGSPHQANLVSATQLTISLTTSDLATVGTFPVVVTNPPPGGGSSTAAVFAVTADEISNEWTWIGGSSTVSTAGKYGTLGIPSVNNMPGSRYEASSWTDSGGKLWLFGGQGLDSTGALASLNDLWVFDPSADTWVWLSGSKTGGASAVYGVEGVPATTNVPGARIYSSSWIDSTNHLWLFGGQGVGSNGVAGFLDDLWEFDPVAKTWTWVSGSSMSGVPGVYGTQGVPSTSNVPGSRYFAISWIDSKNNLWLFGGEGEASTTFYAQLDDLWEFNPAAKTWTWVSGSSALNVDGVYGTKGVPSSANAPGSRSQGVSWLDSSGNLWLFGGIGWTSSGGGGVPVNDLWKFDPNAKTWVWVAGSSTNYNPDGTVGSIGIYGTQGVASPNNTPGGRTNPANWIDSKGVFWLFGGTGYDAAGTWGSLNDLWKFDPSTSQWTWIGGSNTVNAIGTYGTLGVPASPNIPGSRYYPVAWSDGTGGFWMFGGEGYDSKGVYGTLNDLWRYQP
jgi:N-acetylneuraminic acid mutarotase